MILVNIILTFLTVCSLLQSVKATKQIRDGEINFGNFKRYVKESLSGEIVASILVKDSELACVFKCVNERRCFSLNVATQADSNGLYLCELLATDKYRAENPLQPNVSFHHYGFASPCESNPCQNSGACVPDFQQNSYHCDCVAGLAGTHCQVCKFDFEDGKGITGWVKTGTAFDNQPTYGDNSLARSSDTANLQEDWYIGGYENRPSIDTPAGQIQGDAAQGNLSTPSFRITGQYIYFLIGGGSDINAVRAELIVNNQVVRNAANDQYSETMVRKTWDVQEFIGQIAHVKLVDANSGGWGHLNFDDLKGDISCEEN